MTYNGSQIEKPTLAIIEQCIKQLGYKFSAAKVYAFWAHRNWKERDGYKVDSIEDAVERYNKKFPVKKSHLPQKPLRKIRRNAKRRTVKRKANKNFKEEHPKIPYKEQLKDKRWFDFREKILKTRGRACENCGSTTHLQVHHLRYRALHYAWEYKVKEVVVLCAFCHAKVHGKL